MLFRLVAAALFGLLAAHVSLLQVLAGRGLPWPVHPRLTGSASKLRHTHTHRAAIHRLPRLPPASRLVRNILADKPRVTKFPIEWDAAREASGMEVDS